nr:putative P10 protein [Southern bean mosaic virus]
TVAEPLNYQRAAGSRPLPPFLNLQATTSKKEKQPLQEECPLDLLGSRLASLESCVEKILQMKSLELLESSRNCQTSPGLSEAPKQSFTPCYSKQE